MDSEHLKKMDAPSVIWTAIQLSGIKRREAEKAQDWSRGTVDRWVSSKDPHLPNVEDFLELIVMTMGGRSAENNLLVQWLIARANDGALLYETPPLKPEELTKLFLEFSADFGVAAIATYDAVQDRKIERVEAMRLNKALMDIISTAQQLQQGLSPYV